MKKVTIFVVLLASLILSACYINDNVNTDQIGAQLKGGQIRNCVGPGIYTDMGFFSDLVELSTATLTFNVSDPEVATQDNQLVGVSITIQARRGTSCDEIKNMLTNWSPLRADQALIDTVSATAREGIKVGTRNFTLEQLLNDRNGLATSIKTHIEEDAKKYSVSIINVTIENIALDPKYAELLQQKALYTAEIDKEKRRQDLVTQKAETDRLEQEKQTGVLQAQLDKEKAQTDVDVEIASREGKKVSAANAVYLNNAAAFELEKLRLLKEILGDKTTIYFVPDGTDITLLLSQLSQGQSVVPVPQGATP